MTDAAEPVGTLTARRLWPQLPKVTKCPRCVRGKVLGVDPACINCGWSQTELTDYEKGLDFMQSILDATEKYSVGPAF